MSQPNGWRDGSLINLLKKDNYFVKRAYEMKAQMKKTGRASGLLNMAY